MEEKQHQQIKYLLENDQKYITVEFICFRFKYESLFGVRVSFGLDPNAWMYSTLLKKSRDIKEILTKDEIGSVSHR